MEALILENFKEKIIQEYKNNPQIKLSELKKIILANKGAIYEEVWFFENYVEKLNQEGLTNIRVFPSQIIKVIENISYLDSFSKFQDHYDFFNKIKTDKKQLIPKFYIRLLNDDNTLNWNKITIVFRLVHTLKQLEIDIAISILDKIITNLIDYITFYTINEFGILLDNFSKNVSKKIHYKNLPNLLAYALTHYYNNSGFLISKNYSEIFDFKFTIDYRNQTIHTLNHQISYGLEISNKCISLIKISPICKQLLLSHFEKSNANKIESYINELKHCNDFIAHTPLNMLKIDLTKIHLWNLCDSIYLNFFPLYINNIKGFEETDENHFTILEILDRLFNTYKLESEIVQILLDLEENSQILLKYNNQDVIIENSVFNKSWRNFGRLLPLLRPLPKYYLTTSTRQRSEYIIGLLISSINILGDDFIQGDKIKIPFLSYENAEQFKGLFSKSNIDFEILENWFIMSFHYTEFGKCLSKAIESPDIIEIEKISILNKIGVMIQDEELNYYKSDMKLDELRELLKDRTYRNEMIRFFLALLRNLA